MSKEPTVNRLAAAITWLDCALIVLRDGEQDEHTERAIQDIQELQEKLRGEMTHE